MVPLFHLCLFSKHGDISVWLSWPRAGYLSAAVSKLSADQLTQWLNDLARLWLFMPMTFISVYAHKLQNLAVIFTINYRNHALSRLDLEVNKYFHKAVRERLHLEVVMTRNSRNLLCSGMLTSCES